MSPTLKPGPRPDVAEANATLPPIPGATGTTPEQFLKNANCTVGHVTITAQIAPNRPKIVPNA